MEHFLPSLSICCLVTSVAHYSYRRRWEEKNSLAEQSILPQGEDLNAEELDELRETASRVSDLQVDGEIQLQYSLL